MIAVKLMGGLGNQMFQYAAARRLANKHSAELFLDLRWFDEIPKTDTPRFYELGDYPIKARLIDMFSVRLRSSNKRPTPLERALHRTGADKRIWELGEPSAAFYPAVLRASDNTYLLGWWQNEKYFKDIRQILLKEFEPKTPPNTKNKKYLEKIKNSEAVSIHVRRDDYITNKHANKFHGLTPIEYYQKAFGLIKGRVGSQGLHLFVFSTDIDWCKKNLSFGTPMTFVEGNKKGSDDMSLMKHCKHNIMANSSFSWWGAWLNKNPDKIVIAPKNWFQDPKADSETEIVPDSWTRL
ncbi:MAG: hypothetical protein A3F35_00395 [Candidatus Woykebacteria bacterium RIFCSPHIGHO2_12_FULL_45_10]|uniref:Alpha-1,2-fucosyltransferase n=1 Tax=Candidatus Woykebacteria bacterium RIFCSPHIGHO2_12_FULL_45_10 TaxID=1802603 RepID=A0A1G1WP27_9BACT|nr:MAG: hypothetical protein A3F35_00395 [Candidatus Woykebacteria bacterium RIFCSPHIGHO2_12_FULL_45_10]